MAFEIEHKYLVINDSYLQMQTAVREIKQGYLSRNPERTVRVRIVDDKGYITVKGLTNVDIRHEFEYSIPYEDAVMMLEMCVPPIISKKRHLVPYEGHIWEVDEFQGDLSHVVVAEIELKSRDEKYSLPPFVGADITGNPAYYNSQLHLHK